ncbi:MAG: hydrolase [Acidimicrobiales bacterium]|nr:hydrolase [Acidimicrobiales bacterium]
MWFCDQCGQEATGGDPLAGTAPTCPVHGPRWRLVRNAPCAAAVVVRDGLVLLGRRANEPFRGWWEVPGGFVERGEHPAAAAIREVREELGIAITLTGLIGIYVEDSPGHEIPPGTIGGARVEDLQVTVFEATTTETSCEPDPAEVSDWAWFRPEDIPGDLAGRHRIRIDDWLAGRTVPLPADGLG